MPHAASRPTEGFFAQLLARWREQAELSQLPSSELGRIAHELGMSSDELTEIASHGSHGSDLLYERMAALGIARDDIDRVAHGLIRDLEKSCSCCADKGQCTRDLDAHPEDPVWKEYCPNAIALESVRRCKGRGSI